MKHIIKHLSELLGVEVQFANDCMGEEAAVKAAALQPGEVLLLETFASMLKKKANQEVWLKMQLTKKKLLLRKQ